VPQPGVAGRPPFPAFPMGPFGFMPIGQPGFGPPVMQVRPPGAPQLAIADGLANPGQKGGGKGAKGEK